MNKKLITTLSILSSFALGSAHLNAQGLVDLSSSADGQFTSSWFGSFSQSGATDSIQLPGWIQHEEHGYLHITEAGEEAIWIFDPNLAAIGLPGWLYVDQDNFPYFYVFNEEESFWVAYVVGVTAPEPTPRVFVVYNSMDPVLLAKRTTDNIAALAGQVDDLSTLLAAVGAADPAVAAALTGEGPLTVFAPTNAAFAALGDTVATLLEPENQGTLSDILTYHVVAGEFTAADLSFNPDGIFQGQLNTFFLSTVAGPDIRVDVTPMGVLINNSATVVIPNVYASNGIVHVIDAVILPPENLATVASNSGFDTLVAAVGAADPAVAAALTGEGPLTVFAPTNEAFAALGDTVATLLEPENQATLTEILLYHTVAGKIYASEVPTGTPVPTSTGATIEFTVGENGELLVNGIEIIATNVTASNGVIHVIDGVLLPPAE